jgi:hypothetical protein
MSRVASLCLIDFPWPLRAMNQRAGASAAEAPVVAGLTMSLRGFCGVARPAVTSQLASIVVPSVRAAVIGVVDESTLRFAHCASQSLERKPAIVVGAGRPPITRRDCGEIEPALRSPNACHVGHPASLGAAVRKSVEQGWARSGRRDSNPSHVRHRRLHRAIKPDARMMRATRLRPTRIPVAGSSAWTRRLP